MKLGKVLKMLRKELHFSQSDLANALNISLVTVSRWETGRNVPNRSACVAIMELAAVSSASAECMSELRTALPELKSEESMELNHANIGAANQILNDAFSGIYVCDYNSYELRYVNETLCKMVGKSMESATGRKCYEYLMNRSTPCPFCSMHSLKKDGFAEREFTNNMSGRHYYMRGKLMNWKGQLSHVEYISDETERQDNVGTLRDLTGRLPCGIGIYNIYPDNTAELVYLNDGFYSLMGCTRAERESRQITAFDSVYPVDRELLMHELQAAIREGRNASAEIRIMKRPGQYCWFGVNASIAGREKDRTVMYLSFNDIDRIKSMQLRLEDNRRAVELATSGGNMTVWTFNISTGEISRGFTDENFMGYPGVISGGPEALVAMGGIYAADIEDFLKIYNEVRNGEARSEATVRIYNRKTEKYEWQRIVLMRRSDQQSSGNSAIGFSVNVDLQKEHEIRYAREVKLRHELMKDCIAYYRINLSNHMVEELHSDFFETEDIKLPMKMEKLLKGGLVSGVTDEYRSMIYNALTPETMLNNYNSGKTTETLVYRRNIPGKGVRWIRATISKLKRVSSDDVIAFYSAVDIDDEKKEQTVIRDIMEEEIERVTLLKPKTREVRVLMSRRHEGELFTGSSFISDDKMRESLTESIIDEDKKISSDFINADTIDERLRERPILQCLYRTVSSDGSIKRKKVRAFYADNTKAEVIFVQRDITDLYEEEQRQKRRLQRAKDEADRANNAKSDFLSRMSHDMRTPLNAIISYSDTVLREGISSREKDEYLDDINASGKYLLGIINDVLDMSKIDSNKMTLRPEPYILKEFIETMKTVIEPLCEKKNVSFITDFPEDGNIPVMLDKVHFNQIFINLLSNAVKFTPSGGKVELTMQRIPLGDDKLAEHFEVRDNGCGMSKSFLPHAFESFTQEYSSQSMHNEQGTGLGLSIVKKLVELMDGNISVKSRLGEGSVFTVDLEVEIANKGNNPKGNIADSDIAGLKVLLCEDHPTNAKIATKLLAKVGCTVQWAKNGKEGLDMFCKEPPGSFDIILMDIRMPVMDGISSAKAIRISGKNDAFKVPIIAMTANAFDEDTDASLKAGMNAHLTKPIDAELLYGTIARLDPREKRNGGTE